MERQSLALIVPTLNAGRHWPTWLAAFAAQTLQPSIRLIIDSSSSDATAELAAHGGFEIKTIARNQFNHGATRQLAIETYPNVEIFIFLTQDAILANPSALAYLVSMFDDPYVGAAYGRQIPHPDATPLAAHVRHYNYPATSRVKSMSDIPSLGLRTAFCSNSMAAYRRTALMRCGGFPRNTIVNEDMYVAGKMILEGLRIAYCAQAVAYHSHNYRFLEEFKRYFDQGVFHARNPWLRNAFGNAESEGMPFGSSLLRFLGWRQSYYLPSAILRLSFNLLGYRLGGAEALLPIAAKRRLSMHPRFWK